MKWCTDHALSGQWNWDCGPETLGTCKRCPEMISLVVFCSIDHRFVRTVEYNYGGQYHIDKNLPSIIGQFCTLKNAA